MLRIGLTGGIGSGKSAVAELFAELGIPLIDADLIAREMVRTGQPALRELVSVFGREILQQDGNLDRLKMRDHVFSDHGAKQTLESILHPRIRERINQLLNEIHSPYVIMVIPLLLETGYQSMVDRILVVDVPLQTQLNRVCGRDRMTQDQAMKIITSQCGRGERLLAADDLIDNSGPVEALGPIVRKLHHRYLELANAGNR